MTRTLFWLTAIALLLSLSCAKQTTPTGGPKDTIPPVLLQAIPPDKAIQFNSQTITLLFDEYIQIDNAREQLLITPTISPEDIEVIAQKKRVLLTLNVPLDSNTTYAFNFRDAVKDVTERNPAENLLLAYSTGTYIDSLQITGIAKRALTNQPVENATVALVSYSDTFNIFKHKPIYVTKADKQGNFLIQNLKPDNYLLYSFDDKNKNLIVDSKSESYGYLSQPIRLSPDSIPFTELNQVNLDTRNIQLISARTYNTYYNIRLSKAFQYANIHFPTTKALTYLSTPDQTNIKIYALQPMQDSIPISLSAIDSLGTKLDTLLYARFPSTTVRPETFTTRKLSSTYTTSPSMLHVKFQLSKPLNAITYDSITFQLDSATFVSINQQHASYDTLAGILSLSIPVDPVTQSSPPTQQQTQPSSKAINQFTMAKGALISIEGDSTTAVSEKLTPLSESSTGTLLFQLNTRSAAPLVQLLDNQYRLLQQISDQKEGKFANVPPGTYHLRLIDDHNQNKKWDAGNFFTKQEPEDITFYLNPEGKTTINVKANWEIGPLLITDQ